MNKGLCYQRKKMMMMGVEEKPCPISRVPTKFPAEEDSPPVIIDSYSQARKALAERSPFDSEDVQNSTIPTLPSSLAGFLFKPSSDSSRKRHKKSSHLGGLGTQSSSKPEKTRGVNNIWAETEEYFQQLTPEDVDKLYGVSSFRTLNSHNLFLIPNPGNSNTNDNDATAIDIDRGVAVAKEEVEHFMEVDGIGAAASVANELPLQAEEKVSCSGVEWLLGSRSKIYLTSERPSKKRKLLGGEAGLEKLFVARPVKQDSASLCHYCSQGDMGNQLNRFIVCSSCGLAVHQRCYGVQDDEAGRWLCSWCKNGGKCIDRPCLLCPQQGGALKLVRKRGDGNDNGGSMEFAHLFCAQWMPEVYIEDTRSMGPIMNIEGIKDTRRKLICYLCKVKCGACVRCSNGACRTSFHPICAREARHRMEIWGKFGCEDVELRAFCSNHSELQNNSRQQVEDVFVAVSSDSSITEHEPLLSAVNKLHKLRIGRRNGGTFSLNMETTHTEADKVDGCLSSENGLLKTKSNSKHQLGMECGDAQRPIKGDTVEKNGAEDAKVSESLILKKLIDRGKVELKDVASEIGVSPDSLASNIVDDCLVPDLRCKIVKWIRNHTHIGTLQKTLKAKIKSSIIFKAEMGVTDDKIATTAPELDVPDVLPVKSVPPRRRTKSNTRMLKDKKVINSFKEGVGDDGIVMDEDSGRLVQEDQNIQSTESLPDATEKVSVEPCGGSDILACNSFENEGDLAKCLRRRVSGSDQDEEAVMEWNTMGNSNLGNDDHSVATNDSADATRAEALSGPYIHPLIHKKFSLMQNRILSQITVDEDDGSRDRDVSSLEASSSSRICCNHQIQNSSFAHSISEVNLKQLVKAKNMSILDLSPVDEVEGELVYYQHKLLCNAVAKKHFSDDLIHKVVKCLPKEIDTLRKQNWDVVLVNQYLCELREAKKQGRKERRHKEVQAVLAAATAAAAASSRISSFRKDTVDESGHQENLLKLNPLGGRSAIYSQQMPRAKEALPRLAVARISSEKNSDSAQSTLDVHKEHSRICDICRRIETILNPIVVCSSCKVAVHMDCYRSVKDSTGPWYCELCDDLLSSRSRGAPALNTWEKPLHVAECGLCGGTAGAFRKSTNSQWVHAFCAEWVLESTFRRGQINPVEGMEAIAKGSDFCFICSREQGVCIKCNYGHCQSTFHPSCGRSAGFYMNVRTNGGKLLHKAYCEKHSLVERTKVERYFFEHGVEEWNSLKKVRVELERLRLICERIIKREKLKRELVLCSHAILGSNRDSTTSSMRDCSSFFSPDVSSESATTSLKGYVDGYKSGSEAIQRLDDITIDSTIGGKRGAKFPMSMDNDQKTDDSSTSQLFTQNPTAKASFSGKQIPHRLSSAASRSNLDDGEKRSRYRKHTETFEKELMMTSDQASMRNQRLPKGFVYVPIRCLSNEKGTVADASSHEHSDNDG